MRNTRPLSAQLTNVLLTYVYKNVSAHKYGFLLHSAVHQTEHSGIFTLCYWWVLTLNIALVNFWIVKKVSVVNKFYVA